MKSGADTAAFASTLAATASAGSGEAPAPPAQGVARVEPEPAWVAPGTSLGMDPRSRSTAHR